MVLPRSAQNRRDEVNRPKKVLGRHRLCDERSLRRTTMSIHLEGPSLLLNSYDFADAFGGCGMLMDKTWNCPKNTTAKHVANWIGVAAKDAGGSLANVVLNFHGEPGRVLVGEATEGK